jgi:hypothetical protein
MSELSERQSETSEPLDISSTSCSDADEDEYPSMEKDKGHDEYAVLPVRRRDKKELEEEEEEEVDFKVVPKNLVIHAGKMVTFDCVVLGKKPIGKFN